MRCFNALMQVMKHKDVIPMERLEYNRVRMAIEEQCSKYLRDVDDELTFEALPSAIDAALAFLESPQFLEKYEFAQVSESCFVVRMKELEIF